MTSNSKRSANPPRPNDVICGRGGLAPRHIGNQNYRKLIEANLESYASCAKFEKIELAKRIVDTIRTQNPPGRFIQRNKEGIWTELELKKVIRKTSQTFRDISLEIRRTNNDQTSLGSSLSITDSMISECFARTSSPTLTPTQPSALTPAVPEEKTEIAPDDARPVPSDIYISESERDLGKWLEHVDFDKLHVDDGAAGAGAGRALPMPLPLDVDAAPVEERGRSA